LLKINYKRNKKTIVVGTTGTGKSTILENIK